ncbi:MAG: PD40 domain-containing protein [Desulfobacterales bacterium]|nr:PD40 domain-containing protein [Desulfobacterales bacterium]
MKTLLLKIFFIIFILLFYLPSSYARYNPSWNWLKIETAYFIIYYPEGHEDLAQRVLSLTNEVYEDVTGFVGITPRQCPIILNPATDIINGFFDVLPNRISLFETPPYSLKEFGHSSDLMDNIFTHEYTHYVHITAQLGWYGNLTKVIGNGFAISNILSPGWVHEGAATYAETIFTDGGRGRSSLFLGEMMSFTESKGIWGLTASGVNPVFNPPSVRIYLSGYNMIEYLNREYGPYAFSELAKYQAMHPIGGIKSALKYVTKKDSKTFYKDFIKDFETRANSIKENVLSDGIPMGDIIISEPMEDFIAHFWTDRNTIIAFRTGYEKKNAIVEIDPVSEKIIKENFIGIMHNIPKIAILPNENFAFVEIFLHPLGNGEIDVTDLVVFDAASKKRSRITKNQHIFSASLSPDGKKFVAAKRNGMWIDIVTFNADGSEITPLTSIKGAYFESPCWSPDGKMIASVAKINRNSDIVLINPESGQIKTFFKSDVYEDSEPSFSPDGNWIVFSSDRSGIFNIYAWDLLNKKLYQLTSVFYAASMPQISKDGNTLSFLNLYRGVRRICSIPFEPLKGREITVENGETLDSPDTKRLAPDISFEKKKGLSLKEYKPFIHVPYFGSDEDGGKFGFSFMGSDPIGINTYQANIHYGLRSERPGYDILLENNSFWPTIGFRIYDMAQAGKHNDTDYWYREQGDELYLGLNIIFQTTPSYINSSIRIGGKIREISGLENIKFNTNQNKQTEIFIETEMDRIPDSARKDVVPIWGQSMYMIHEEGLSDPYGEINGHNTLISGIQYLPSLINHHGFELRMTGQQQSGYYRFEKDLSIPRGYSDDDEEGGLNLRKNLLVSGEYHFPLWYADTGLGLIFYYMSLLKSSVFIDYGSGWNDSFDIKDWTGKARTSIGTTLTAKSVIMNVLPVELGISAGYKVKEGKGFVNFLFMLQF